MTGLTMLGLFLDELNPLSKEIHPALPTISEEKQSENKLRGDPGPTGHCTVRAPPFHPKP